MRKVLAIVAIALAGALIAPPFASADELDDFLGWQPAKINQLPSQHTVPDLTKEDFNKSWSDAPKRNPSPAQKRGEASKLGGKVGGKLGAATLAISGLTVGMDIGSGIAHVVGLPTTGSRSCDFMVAVFNDSQCRLAQAETYVVNTDIEIVDRNWVSGQTILGCNDFDRVYGIFTTSVHCGAFDAPGRIMNKEFHVNSITETSTDYVVELTAVLVGTLVDTVNYGSVSPYYGYLYSSGSYVPYPWKYGGWSSAGTIKSNYSLGGGLTASNPSETVTINIPKTQTFGQYVTTPQTVQFLSLGSGTGWCYTQAECLQLMDKQAIVLYRLPSHGEYDPVIRDPQRAWQVSGMCMDGNPFSVNSPWFVETGEWEPMPTIPCNPSAVTVSQLITGHGEQVMMDWQLPAEVQQWAIDNPDGSKELDLLRIGGTSERVSCFDDSTNCADWWMDPQKNQNFECRYGGQPVALSECNVYRPTFNPLQTTQGVRYADREGRLPEIKPTVVPGGVTLPESNGGECFPSGWGVLNPVEWVLKPTKCALSWAFVPKSQTMTNTLNTTKTLLMTKPPFSLVAPVGAVITGLGDGWGGECSGSLGNFGMGMVVPCSPEDVGIAWNVARHVMNLGLIITTCFVLWRMFISALGAKGGDA